MQTSLPDSYVCTPEGKEADRILRSCVHCGFCNATCPTYQLLGDELDGPRGRIYLIKSLLEGKPGSRKSQFHLDRCLGCRACETTCPSGVEYSRLLDIGRQRLEKAGVRPFNERVQHFLLRKILPYPRRFRLLLRLGQGIRLILPAALSRLIPGTQSIKTRQPGIHRRKVLLIQGCVQSSLAPGIDAAATNVLDRLNIMAIPGKQTGCCGALSHHLSATEEALDFMRANIDAWWPQIEEGVEAIVMTASGCSAMIKEYGYLLKNDAAYSGKAERVSALCRDICEVVADEDLSRLKTEVSSVPKRIAFQSPCTLQHGQRLNGIVEQLLEQAGFELVPVADKHLCCGSAGTYSILQPALSRQLRKNKLDKLEAEKPDMIVTANIGCYNHLAAGTETPVRHWIELLDR